MTSYRAELAGIVDLLEYQLDHYPTTPMEIWCDNEAVVRVLQKKTALSLADLSKAEGDLVKAAKLAMHRLDHTTISWVKGHQVDDGDPSDAPTDNTCCDHYTGKCREERGHPSCRPTPKPGSGAALFLGNAMVATQLDEQVRYVAHAPRAKNYLMAKYDWTNDMFDTVNWKGVRHAIRRQTKRERLRATKALLQCWMTDLL